MHAAIRAMSPIAATDPIACYLVGYRFYQLNRQNEAIEQLDKCHDEKIRAAGSLLDGPRPRGTSLATTRELE
jgi:hypothetical protein